METNMSEKMNDTTYCHCPKCGTDKAMKDKKLLKDWPSCPKCKKLMVVDPWKRC